MNTLEKVAEFLSTQKVSGNFKAELLELLTNELTKQPTTRSTNPPKKLDDQMWYFCRFHNRYENEAQMVISNNKSKGYCKASISLWNKRNSAIKKLNEQMANLALAGQTIPSELLSQLTTMKEELNDVASYDYDRDWFEFNSWG